MRRVWAAAILIFVLVMGSSIANSFVKESDFNEEDGEVKKKDLKDVEVKKIETPEDEGTEEVEDESRGHTECNSTVGLDVEGN